MIPVRPAPEPRDFDETVRQPGTLALHERIGRAPPTPRTAGQPCAPVEGAVDFADLDPEHLPPYWTRALDALMTAYDRICAYSCFYIHPITGARSTDHMIPKSSAWDRVYEWRNYRLSAARLNARKRDYQDVLDPFEVGDDWFEMEFVGFQLRSCRGVPESIRRAVERTIERLGLNDAAMLRAREDDFRAYVEADVSLAHLERYSPLVARQIRRTGRLLPADRSPR